MRAGAELATFPCADADGENLIRRARLKPGESVVSSGASGGVGSASIQLCRPRGARVIAIACASKADRFRQLGGHHLVERDVDDLEGAPLTRRGWASGRISSAGAPQMPRTRAFAGARRRIVMPPRLFRRLCGAEFAHFRDGNANSAR